jgi:heme ABC exporter ATP-binding subunit CcmA
MNSEKTDEMALLELIGIRKQYDTKAALKDVNLSVEKGSTVTLLGPNGAGKTTLLKIMSGIMAPTEGKVLYHGNSGSSRRLKADTFYLGHKNSLYSSLTVLENLNFFSDLFALNRNGHIEDILREHGLWERRHDPVRELSQGMKRRLALTRGFVTGQTLIALDEPFVGLDMKWRALVVEKVESLKRQGKTLVLSTHLVEEGYALADYVAFMHKGTLSFVKERDSVSLDEIKDSFCTEVELACR